ncbi:hypothetical protein BDB01DRAFT_483367 [Pilobolus umbonatus]|nr:hypothetical protein BDB01DRAFT_483367 [Pilobolus umbonatus]
MSIPPLNPFLLLSFPIHFIMNDLPLELIQIISQLIDPVDSFQCLSVNKAWNYAFTKNIYYKVIIKHLDQLLLFLESATLYPNSVTRGRYIRYIDISFLQISSNEFIDSIIKNSLPDAISNCPNLEHLFVYPSDSIISAILHPKVPILRQMRHLEFDHEHIIEENQWRILNCYSKFNSTLTHIYINSWLLIVSNYDERSIASYLAEFPCLESVEIQTFFQEWRKRVMFENILTNCPKLVHLTVKSTSFTMGQDDSFTGKTFTQLKTLVLHVADLRLADVWYMKSHLTGLKRLELGVESDFNQQDEVCEVLASFRHLDHFTFTSQCLLMETAINKFYNQTDLSEQVSVNNSFKISRHEDEEFTNITITNTTDTRIISITASLDESMIPTYDRYLREVGACLHVLEIDDEDCELEIDLEIINESCPLLERLYIESDLLVIPNSTRRPNHNLMRLVVTRYFICNSTFNNIERLYPRLQELTFINCGSFCDNIKCLSLPSTLKVLDIKDNHECGSTNILVIKEVDGHIIQSWHQSCSLYKKTIITYSQDVMSTTDLLCHGPLLILKSSTVEDVTFS